MHRERNLRFPFTPHLYDYLLYLATFNRVLVSASASVARPRQAIGAV